MAATTQEVIYVTAERTPPAVWIVLGQRPGWTEWDAHVHGTDEVRRENTDIFVDFRRLFKTGNLVFLSGRYGA